MALTPELADKIEKVLAAATGGALVRSMERCYSMLMEAGLLYHQKVHSSFIGVHPSNRDGCGVSAKHVHELLADLVGLGWSTSEFRGLCVEVSDSERSDVFRWNQELAENSEGRVPGFPSETHLKFATLAGSHTNQVLRCFLHKVPSDAGKATEGGRLSLESLQRTDPDFHAACTEGAVWRIVSKVVPQRFPSFCQLAQSAANASGHVAREESELQLCRKIHGEVARHMGLGKSTVNYVDVKDAVLRSKPRSAGTVPALFVFTLRYSGGQHAHLLQETEKFVRAHGFNSRMLGPEIFEALNTEVKVNDPGAQVRHMLLHFAYGVEDGRALSVSDVKKTFSAGMAGKREEATRLLEACKALCVQHTVQPAIALKAVGYLQVNMVAVLLEKKKFKKHASLQQAAEQFVKEIQEAANLAHELDDQGRNKDDIRLRAAGYEVGQTVLRKSDSSTGKIEAMTASEVSLQVEGEIVTVASESFLAGEWRPYASKEEAVPVAFEASLPVNSSEFLLAEAKARILQQIRADEASGSAHYGNLQLFLKPGNVKAGKRFEKSELVLVPSTHRIDFKKPGSASAGAIVAGLVDIKGCTYEVKLKMTADATWQIPFARNTKVINAGDSLVLGKRVLVQMQKHADCMQSCCTIAGSTHFGLVLLAAAGLEARRLRINSRSSCSSLQIHVAPMAKPCRVDQVWSITGGKLKKKSTWLVKTKVVEDRLFVLIDKWDRHFIQFVTGHPLELRKEKDPHHLSIPAYQDLLDLRQSACDELYNKHLRDAAAIAGDAEPRHRNAREEDLYLAGRIVDMRCPAINRAEEEMPAQIISALWSVKDPVLWIELAPQNLDYIALFMRQGLAAHIEKNEQSRRRKKLRGDVDDVVVKPSPKKKNRRSRKRKAAHVEEEEEAEEEPEAIQNEAPPPAPSSPRDSDAQEDDDSFEALLRS
ncbi:unnamed protein product [Symbiodinium sp. CCMP2592]|nr:unnamed protein product [Symbiodinium sp. CCMP2592]